MIWMLAGLGSRFVGVEGRIGEAWEDGETEG